MLEVMINS